MSRELLVLRHAKSDWNTPGQPDFDRPLAKRGRREAPRVGEWLAREGLVPDAVVCSPALRTRQTLTAVLERLDMTDSDASFDRRLYAASLESLLEVLRGVPTAARRVLLIGHNPGVDDLVLYLSAGQPPLTDNGKLMTTAAVAYLELPGDWSQLERGCGRLVRVMRPKEVD